jgi:hypothetical protein
VRIDVRQLFKVSESRQLIFEMDFGQRDKSRFPLGVERFYRRIIGRAAVTSSMGEEENIASAGKELA